VRALVTGAGGFVGAHLAARLVADGWAVVGTVRPGAAPWRLSTLGVATDVECVEVDLADASATAAVAAGSGCDVAFLLAAARGAGTQRAQAATAAVNGASGGWVVGALPPRCRAVVRLGSSTEYAASDRPMDEATPVRPRGFFGATKAEGSRLVAEAAAARRLRAVILRAFQVYGPFDHPGRLVPAAFRAARGGSVLPLTDAGRCRDWVHVDDVVEACLRSAQDRSLPPGQVLNIGTGRQVANEALVAAAARATGRPIRVETGAHPGRAWDTASWVCDPSLAQRLLGWTAAVRLEDGLAQAWAAEQAAAAVAP
jgi:nucleoside-diphosphate-sugar epimerase